MEPIEKTDIVKLDCVHTYCTGCILGYLQTKPIKPCCSLCRKTFIQVNVINIDSYNKIKDLCL